MIPQDRQSTRVHRLISLLAKVLLAVEVEMPLAVSELLAKKEMIPHESVILEGEEEVMLSSSILAASWCSWEIFFWLD